MFGFFTSFLPLKTLVSGVLNHFNFLSFARRLFIVVQFEAFLLAFIFDGKPWATKIKCNLVINCFADV